MLTAVSVARECGLLEKTEKVIMVTTDTDSSSIRYSEDEEERPPLTFSLANKSVS